MIEFRKQLMDKIIQSQNEKAIESIIKDSVNRLIENGINMHIINRFEEKLESDLYLELSVQHNETELLNFKEALRVIKEINMQNCSVFQQ